MDNSAAPEWTPAPGPRRPVANVLRALKRSFRLRGRASRAEFWWYTLFSVAVVTLLAETLDLILVADGVERNGLGWSALRAEFINYPTSSLVECLLLPASVAVFWRRLNDIGWPGWLALTFLVMTVAAYVVAPTPGDILPDMLPADPLSTPPRLSFWDIMSSEYGWPYLAMMMGQVAGMIVYIVVGLRKSAPRNAHGPHPYAPPTSDVFR